MRRKTDPRELAIVMRYLVRRFPFDTRKRELEPIARRMLRGRTFDERGYDVTILELYRHELARLEHARDPHWTPIRRYLRAAIKRESLRMRRLRAAS